MVNVRLEAVSLDHAAALLVFEITNRAFFAAHIGDRGDEFFKRFDDRLTALVAECDAGTSMSFVLIDDSDEIVGRVNISDIDRPEETELGFRVAERVQGVGVARRGVRRGLQEAAAAGVTRVYARASAGNLASRRVLARCGFTATGPAPSPPGWAQPFIGYVIDLAPAE
ncbi:MAG: GNAT family N-acetyltransferase [Austwickia sp.]|jgi:ribosomal-protein-alanine N-acetyltransferase|nr:GNAT family N-acetyltransferase [Austwickia sp.]MBK9101183.1 GNAT family N-acetyltransferase [Austwickia sp.]